MAHWNNRSERSRGEERGQGRSADRGGSREQDYRGYGDRDDWARDRRQDWQEDRDQRQGQGRYQDDRGDDFYGEAQRGGGRERSGRFGGRDDQGGRYEQQGYGPGDLAPGQGEYGRDRDGGHQGGYGGDRGRGHQGGYGGGGYGGGGYQPGGDYRDQGGGGFDVRADEDYRRGTRGGSSWGYGTSGGEGLRGDNLQRSAPSHRGRGPKNYQRSDDRICEDVCDRLSDDHALDASDIEVSVSDREVTLSGEVDSKQAKRRAEDCADSCSGVEHVQNNLRVKSRSDDGGQEKARASRK